MLGAIDMKLTTIVWTPDMRVQQFPAALEDRA